MLGVGVRVPGLWLIWDRIRALRTRVRGLGLEWH